MTLQSAYVERTINELLLMFKSRQINLNPGFRRNSVWTLTDRRRLIQSILARYPLPSIFLYERRHRGGVVYDVIDGKQRLETILMFARQGRFNRDSFNVKLSLNGDVDYYDWRMLRQSIRRSTIAS
jgi:hypothetical protein